MSVAIPFDVVLLFAFEEVLDRLLGLARRHQVEPFGFGTCVVGRDDLDLIAARNLRRDGFELMVDLRADRLVADVGVDVVGEIERRGAEGQPARLAFRCEDDDFGGVERQLEVIQKVDGVFRRRVERIADLLSHLSSSSSFCEMVSCLYFQWAATPLSAMSSMRCVRICTSTHTPSGLITVECSAS